jgi:hypothetical protein
VLSAEHGARGRDPDSCSFSVLMLELNMQADADDFFGLKSGVERLSSTAGVSRSRMRRGGGGDTECHVWRALADVGAR